MTLLECPPPLPPLVGPPPGLPPSLRKADPFGLQQTRPAGNPFLHPRQRLRQAQTLSKPQHYRKTGASFSEALGASPGGAVTADRLIRAIDGLRKAQDEDKTGTKGVVSALKEPEKLDVFLARGCGETKVELCPGVCGKELFHGIKRAGHHAKHMLQLIRWPVLINNRLVW